MPDFALFIQLRQEWHFEFRHNGSANLKVDFLPGHKLSDTKYADDIAIPSDSLQAVQNNLSRLEVEASQHIMQCKVLTQD